MSHFFNSKKIFKGIFLSTLLSLCPLCYCNDENTNHEEAQKENKETLKVEKTAGAIIDSKEGHFSAQLPPGFVSIDQDIQPIQTEMGEIETINYTSFTETSACMVGASEYPEALLVFIKGKEKEVLDGAQEGALKNVNGVVVSSNDLTINNLPARVVEFTAEADGQPLFGKAQFILADSRLYHILYISSDHAELNAPEVLNFFQSFKLIE